MKNLIRFLLCLSLSIPTYFSVRALAAPQNKVSKRTIQPDLSVSVCTMSATLTTPSYSQDTGNAYIDWNVVCNQGTIQNPCSGYLTATVIYYRYDNMVSFTEGTFLVGSITLDCGNSDSGEAWISMDGFEGGWGTYSVDWQWWYGTPGGNSVPGPSVFQYPIVVYPSNMQG